MGELFPKEQPHTHMGGHSPEGHPHNHMGDCSPEGHPLVHSRRSPELCSQKQEVTVGSRPL